MERNTGSYPDPTAERAENGTHPFYAPQQRSMESADDMPGSLVHLTREIGSDSNDQSHAMNHHGLPMTPDQNRPQAAHAHPQHTTYPDNMMPPQASYAHMHPPPPHHQLAAEANMVPTPSAPESAEQRKKPKVTRACDECRRKKIRCSFNGDPPNLQDGSVLSEAQRCSNCTRTNSVCEFSRLPQKRGPSKGYIKELADRLQSVEQKVGGATDQHLGLSSASPDMRSEDYSRGLPQDAARKRFREAPEPLTGATASYGAPDPYSQGTWDSPQHADGSLANPLYSPQGFSHVPYGEASSDRRDGLNQGFSQGDAPALKRRRENSDYSAEMAFYSGESMQLDNALFDNYNRQIYPTYPILVHSKTALQEFLGKVPSQLREAFLRALKLASSQRVLNAAPSVSDQTTTSIYTLLNASNLPGLLQRDVESKVVALQTALLVLIHIDATGPNSIHGSVSPPRGAWLGIASDLAQQMKLYELGGAKNPTELAMATNDLKAVGQRCWWSLVVIDKWYAAGTATAVQIPDSIIRLGLIDHNILGHSLFNLARLTLTYGSIASAFCAPFPITFEHTTHSSIFTRTLERDLEYAGKPIVPETRRATIPYLAYWHVKLLLARHMQSSPTHIYDMISCCSSIRDAVKSPQGVGVLGPLAHHAYILCALTLSELVDANEKREEALKIAREMLIALEPYRVGEPETLKDRGLCWGNAVVPILRGVLEKGGREEGDGLQQLADMAVSVEEGRGEREKDWGAGGRKGFLNLV